MLSYVSCKTDMNILNILYKYTANNAVMNCTGSEKGIDLKYWLSTEIFEKMGIDIGL